MTRFKVASFNGEWMTKLFVGTKAEFYHGPSEKRGPGAKPKNVQLVSERIAKVIKSLKADAVGIVEGPPRKKQMELFVEDWLSGKYSVFSAESGSQSNHILVHQNCPVQMSQVPETDEIYKHLSRKIEYYHWDEVAKATLEDFTRKPAVLRFKIGTKRYELMLFHTKSKISKLKRKKQYTQRDKTAIISALRSRQKLSAEMAAVRRYLSHAILSKRVHGCILMGDLNDGPHRDIFEEHFLIHNIVDELRGGFHREPALMHHAFPLKFLEGKLAYTAEFRDPTRGGKLTKVLLDHVLVTTSIYKGETNLQLDRTRGKIEHKVYENQVDNKGRTRDDRPSDHRPVSAVFQL
jgi:hypothetical protein